MTEKRFTITQDFEEHHRQIRDNGHIIMGCFIEPQAEVIVDFLNQLNDENEELKQSYKEFEDECQSTFNAMSRKQNDLYRKNFKLKEENEQLKSEIEKLSYANEDLLTQKRNWEKLSDEYAKVYEENEQLKQRNDRQAKQLDRIYQLIEEKDWRTLNDILDDFKQCEEQLQREWKCYE